MKFILVLLSFLIHQNYLVQCAKFSFTGKENYCKSSLCSEKLRGSFPEQFRVLPESITVNKANVQFALTSKTVSLECRLMIYEGGIIRIKIDESQSSRFKVCIYLFIILV